MANKVFNMAGGLHSAAALSAYIDQMFGDSVATGLNVVPTGSSGLNVVVKAGTGNISTGQQYGRMIQVDTDETISLAAPSATYARLDTVVAYIDNSVEPTTDVTDNTNDILRLVAVAGTPSGTPQPPTDAQIQSAIGSGNPFMRLANVTVGANAAAISDTDIADVRNQVFPLKGSMIGEKAITSHNLDFTTFEEPVRYTGATSGTHGASPSTIATTTFKFVKNRIYLMLLNVRQASMNSSSVWQLSLNVGSTSVATTRVQETPQMPAPILGIYKATADGDQTVAVTATRLSGSANITVEVPQIMKVPLLYEANS